MNDFKGLSDEQILGFLLMCQFMKQAVEKFPKEKFRGSFLWARHKSDPDFKNESEHMPAGTGKFDATKTWFMAFIPPSQVPLNLGNGLLLSVFIEGKEKSAYFTIDEVLHIAEAIPEGSIQMSLITPNSKGTSDGTLS